MEKGKTKGKKKKTKKRSTEAGEDRLIELNDCLVLLFSDVIIQNIQHSNIRYDYMKHYTVLTCIVK